MNESSDFETICNVWNRPNHVIFQMANVFFLMAFLATNSLYGMLYLRSCLAVASILFSIWGWIYLCQSDVILWNTIFATINAIHFVSIIRKLHLFVKFPKDVERVYRDLFQPMRVSRIAFKTLFLCRKEIQTIKTKEIYAIEGRTRDDKLTLLLSGKVAVIQRGQRLHELDSQQFLDSHQWFGFGFNKTYQVSIVALEESRLLVWNRDKLKLSISSDPYLQTVLDNILGKDVVKKLLLVTDSVGNQNTSAGERSKLIIPTHRAMDQLIKRSPINGNGLEI